MHGRVGLAAARSLVSFKTPASGNRLSWVFPRSLLGIRVFEPLGEGVASGGMRGVGGCEASKLAMA